MISILIFLIAIIAYYTIGKQYQSFVLVLLSLYVYWEIASWNVFIIGFIAGSVGLCSLFLEHHQYRWLVYIPIGILFLGFVFLKANSTGLALPLGYSVLSFTSVSLLVDQYREPHKYRLIDVICYLLFFPKIFAGPIERANNFIDSTTKTFYVGKLYSGFKYLIFAAFCKFIVGDMIASTDMTAVGINLWMQVVSHAIGFFFDFWAYTLMAIGVGLIFGYQLSISFFKPYYSTSFREFWHRWNITLGSWLRDYIYIPLGGKSLNVHSWCGVVLVVFIISGLWHGATWPFLMWGLAHGFLLIIERLFIKPDKLIFGYKMVYSIVVFLLVSFLWQLFIVDNMDEIRLMCTNLFLKQSINYSILIQFIGCCLSYVVLTSNRIFSLVECSNESYLSVIVEVTMLSIMVVALLIMNCPLSFNFFYFRF